MAKKYQYSYFSPDVLSSLNFIILSPLTKNPAPFTLSLKTSALHLYQKTSALPPFTKKPAPSTFTKKPAPSTFTKKPAPSIPTIKPQHSSLHPITTEKTKAYF
ncbi:MAG: hypothetical protein IGQ45_12580 [Cyanobacterium sp. T60_A2020_053]|nr:hypothetical protein [Cyanobacterium sp. T60_A2020_053]